ncbi:MAG: metallophosphoesterase [Actinocatenispora sp.]
MSGAEPDKSQRTGQPASGGGRPPAPRPRNLSLKELGFSRRRPVPWLAPGLLAATAVRVLGAGLFGANLDKRELQAALPNRVDDLSSADEFWFDYVADIGDGFDATYSVAYLLAQQSLTIPGPEGDEHELPRGQMLVMGGDEVYPTPTWRRYENRTRGPYTAALPEPPAKPPALYALPGNHDWYDGLTSFLRLFAKGSRFAGWRTRQARSYFAVSLPHRWWLFAIDSALDEFLDDPQLQYFKDAARALKPGDRVVLCVSRPAWVYGAQEPDAYDTVDYFVSTVIEPTGATVPVILTGDLHHYARYERDTKVTANGSAPTTVATDGAETTRGTPELSGASDGPTGDTRDPAELKAEPTPSVPASSETASTDPAPAAQRSLITCGGGGAYLYPTHLLPKKLSVPPTGTMHRKASRSEPYRLSATFPSPATSRGYSWGIFARLLGSNTGFAVVLGVLHTMLMWAYVTAGPRILTVPVLFLSLLVLGSTLAFAMAAVDVHHRVRHWAAGITHGLAHLALAALGAYAWWVSPLAHLPGPIPVLLSIIVYLPIAGVAGTELTALYLLVGGWFGVNIEELFAGQGIDDAKSFLRMRIGTDGQLTIYPIGLRRVGRRWRAHPSGETGTPWIVPRRKLTPHLIEKPVNH